MGDVSFYHTGPDGYLARQKGGVSGDRIKNDSQFERTRENGEEFGNANEAARLVRNSLRALIAGAADSRMVSRFGARMIAIAKSDSTSVRGKRNVADGDLTLLQGFEFNVAGKLAQTLYVVCTPTVDRVAGTATINLPAFVPQDMIAAPPGATHARLVSGVASVDFRAKTYTVVTAKSADIVLGPQEQPTVNLTHLVGPNNTRPLFVALGIDFLQDINGALYPLKVGSFNALSLIAVDTVE